MSDTLPAELAPGLYFDLDAETYHADPAFSTSGAKKVLVSPLTYWRESRMCPGYVEMESDAAALGTAFHKRILEGRDLFYRIYAGLPRREDHPDALDGAEYLRARCEALGLKKGGTIAELCERIAAADPAAELWPAILAAHRAENDGKILLKPEVAERVEAAATVIESHRDVGRALAGGYPEVSIFWIDTDTGIRMKARIDRLKDRAIVDLKTFANKRGKHVEQAIADAVAAERYHLQAVIYSEAVERAKAMLAERGRAVVFGEVDDGFLSALAAAPEHAFFFVFIESCDWPEIIVREFPRESEGGRGQHGEALAWSQGMREFRAALDLYSAYMRDFGTGRPWINARPRRAFRDDDFPLWMFN